MKHDFIKRFHESAVVQEILYRQEFDPAATVSLTASRDNKDWPLTFAAMRRFCEDNCKARFRPSAPMDSDEVSFLFEDDTDALLFKLRFG